MRYARGPGPDPQLIEAERGRTGTCPGCGSALVAKCGTIVSPHWAHHARPDCDDWSEPESEWHLAWKRHAPPERTEVVMGANREHRADVVLPNGYVLELQHSALSAEAIREREEFYTREAGGMCWLWDARRFWKAVQFRDSGPHGSIDLPRHRTLLLPRCPMFWDVPSHDSPDTSYWYDREARLLQEIQRVETAIATGPESLLEDALTAYKQAVEHHATAAARGRWAIAEEELSAYRAVRAAEARVAELRAAPTTLLAAEDRLQAIGHDLRRVQRHVARCDTRRVLSGGVIAHVVPTRHDGFRIEQLIPRDQFAAAIRGPQ